MFSAILIGENIFIILQTESTFNFEWITCKVCQNWNLETQVINYARFKAFKSNLNISAF